MAEFTRDRSSEHPDAEALLTYLDKDGDGDSVHRSHILSCDRCQQELENIQCIRLALRELPQQQPPAHLWEKVREHGIQPAQRKPFLGRQGIGWLSIAASLLIVSVVVLTQLPTLDDSANPALAALIEENQQLEAALARLENQPSVMRFDTIGQITRLKEGVSAVDMVFGSQFNKPGSEDVKIDLLEKRIRLMRELVEQRARPMLAYADDYYAF